MGARVSAEIENVNTIINVDELKAKAALHPSESESVRCTQIQTVISRKTPGVLLT
jgi:hypothetical protein